MEPLSTMTGANRSDRLPGVPAFGIIISSIGIVFVKGGVMITLLMPLHSLTTLLEFAILLTFGRCVY